MEIDLKKNIREEFKNGSKGYNNHSIEWYINTVDRLFNAVACGAANCECENYTRDNLRYLEALSEQRQTL
jgi:hypothetical protein